MTAVWNFPHRRVIFSLTVPVCAGLPSGMAYYIFTQGRYSYAGWALLETVKRPALAKEVFRNYRGRFDRSAVEMVMVEAASIQEANAKLNRKAEPVAGNYPDPALYESQGYRE